MFYTCSFLGPQEVPRHDFECIPRKILRLKQGDASHFPIDPPTQFKQIKTIKNTHTNLHKYSRKWGSRPSARAGVRGALPPRQTHVCSLNNAVNSPSLLIPCSGDRSNTHTLKNKDSTFTCKVCDICRNLGYPFPIDRGSIILSGVLLIGSLFKGSLLIGPLLIGPY